MALSFPRRGVQAPTQSVASRYSVHLNMKFVLTVLKRIKEITDFGMAHRRARIISDQILLGHIGDVVAFVVFGKKVIERLVLARAAVLRNGLIPLFGIAKLGVDIKDDTAKWVLAVTNNLTQTIFCTRLKHNKRTPSPMHNEKGTKMSIHRSGNSL